MLFTRKNNDNNIHNHNHMACNCIQQMVAALAIPGPQTTSFDAGAVSAGVGAWLLGNLWKAIGGVVETQDV